MLSLLRVCFTFWIIVMGPCFYLRDESIEEILLVARYMSKGVGKHLTGSCFWKRVSSLGTTVQTSSACAKAINDFLHRFHADLEIIG